MAQLIEVDRELEAIAETIKEAYTKDTNRNALVRVRESKLHYPMFGLWCKDTVDRTLLLRIIHKLIGIYPHRTRDMTDNLLDKIPVTDDSTLEICWLVGFISAAQIFEEEPQGESIMLELFRDGQADTIPLGILDLSKTLKEIDDEDIKKVERLRHELEAVLRELEIEDAEEFEEGDPEDE